jgi:hypothetical protein
MEQLELKLTSVRIAGTGMDGGHIYLVGKSNYQGMVDVDVYAFFWDKEEEKVFEESFQGQDVKIVSNKWDYIKGMGITADISEWDYINMA